MRRRERRLFALTDEITRLRATLDQVHAELGMLEHLQDDAVRDAAVGGPIEREDARDGARDVARFRKLMVELSSQIETLDAKRAKLLADLGI
jgi:hypothetical protein